MNWVAIIKMILSILLGGATFGVCEQTGFQVHDTLAENLSFGASPLWTIILGFLPQLIPNKGIGAIARKILEQLAKQEGGSVNVDQLKKLITSSKDTIGLWMAFFAEMNKEAKTDEQRAVLREMLEAKITEQMGAMSKDG